MSDRMRCIGEEMTKHVNVPLMVGVWGVTAQQAAAALIEMNKALQLAEDEGTIPTFDAMLRAAGRKLPGDRGYWRFWLRRLPRRLMGSPW
jgi:hypothetical protein